MLKFNMRVYAYFNYNVVITSANHRLIISFEIRLRVSLIIYFCARVLNYNTNLNEVHKFSNNSLYMYNIHSVVVVVRMYD